MKQTINKKASNSSKTSVFNLGRSTVSGYRCDSVSESKNAPLFDIALMFCDESKKEHDFGIIPHIDHYQEIKEKYPNMAGVFIWEYIQSPPDKSDPSQWCKIMKAI